MTLLDFIENLANNNNNNNNENTDVNKQQATENLIDSSNCKEDHENEGEEDTCFHMEDPELVFFAEDLGNTPIYNIFWRTGKNSKRVLKL